MYDSNLWFYFKPGVVNAMKRIGIDSIEDLLTYYLKYPWCVRKIAGTWYGIGPVRFGVITAFFQKYTYTTENEKGE